MIGSCNCPITANCSITLSDYNFADKLEQNTPVYAPITLLWLIINENFQVVHFEAEARILRF